MSKKEQDIIGDSLRFSLNEIVDALNLMKVKNQNQKEEIDYRKRQNFHKKDNFFPTKNKDGTFQIQDVQYGWDGQKLFIKYDEPNILIKLAKKLPWKEMSDGGCCFHK